jgi:conjugal transfer mating pair stabilization protein TraN
MIKPLLCLCTLLLWFPLLQAKALMEQAKEEAQNFATSEGVALSKHLKKGMPYFSSDDFLPEEDKGKSFDPEIAAEERDVKTFISIASKRERLEETEELFSEPQTEIVSEETTLKFTPERFETCQESGTYQFFLIQKRVVEVSPAKTTQVRHCKGHEKHEKFQWEKEAKEYRKKKERELAKDKGISTSKVKITKGGLLHRYEVVSTWTHKDNIPCKRSWVEEKVEEPASEKDTWETEEAEALSSLSSNPKCRMLYSQIVLGPETRSINGTPIFRDHWERQLFFSCGDDQNSKCVKLRERGAQLHKRRCLKKASFNENECDLWEKVYRISTGTIANASKVVFSGDAIWGLNSNFDSSYEANTDFGVAATTLAVFSDMKQEIEDSSVDFSHPKAKVFKGDVRECQRSFIEGVLYDCCSKMDGIALASKLCRCTSEEKDLAKKRDEGKCRYIGTYKKNLGTEKVQAFCCFSTKLARVIHEEGRKQLGIKWGSAEKPNCSGLSINQLQRMDFSQVDLTEAVEDLKVDKEFIQRKIQDVSYDLQSEGSKLKVKQQTDQVAQAEKEKRGPNG